MVNPFRRILFPPAGLQNFLNCIVTGILKEKCIPIFHVLGHVWNVQNCILDLHFYKDAFPTQNSIPFMACHFQWQLGCKTFLMHLGYGN